MKHKYPRTYHLDFSKAVQSDDKVQHDLSAFEGQEIVVTIKMDGENSTIGNGYYHARSLDSRYHPSRAWLSKFAAEIGINIPAGYRVCGENLYAKHSVEYKDLKSYFYGFSVWDDNNNALSWDETQLYFELLGITSVEVIYRGVFDYDLLKKLADQLDTTVNEGFVVRLAKQFHYNDFSKSVVKFVRANHVQTNKHWMHQEVIANKLSNE